MDGGEGFVAGGGGQAGERAGGGTGGEGGGEGGCVCQGHFFGEVPLFFGVKKKKKRFSFLFSIRSFRASLFSLFVGCRL